jgi:hypothetical protein
MNFPIEEILGPLGAERIKSLLSSESSKVRGLSSSFYHFKVALEPTHSKRRFEAIVVKPLSPNADKLIVGLLWQALFGKSFKTIHWYMLFAVLIKTARRDSASLAMMKILILSTGKPGNLNWMHNHRTIRTTLVSLLGREQAEAVIKEIVEDLPVKLPKKGPIIDELFSIQKKSVTQRKPNEPSRIGVGYKDKGGLGGGLEEPLAGSDFLEREEVFDLLLRQATVQLNGIQIASELRKQV